MTDLTRCKVSLRGYKRAHAHTHSWLSFPQHLHADDRVCMASSLLPAQSQTCIQIKPPAASCSLPLKQMALHKLTREARRNHRAAPLLSAEYPARSAASSFLSKKHTRISSSSLFFSFLFSPPIVPLAAHASRRPRLISHFALR